jgi:nicotinamide-nucleotide amidase
MGAVALLILQRPYPVLVPIADVAVAVAVIFTIVSGIDYLVRFRHLIGLGQGASTSRVDPVADELGELLIRSALTVSVAESCTGGLLGSLITDRPGSSAYFPGGVIAYSDDVKRDELGVPAALIARYGAVSREVAIAMAEGVRSRFGTALAASITCIAGPDAAGTTKPVGLTFIAIVSEDGRRCEEYTFTGDRWSNRRQAATKALRLLVEEVKAGAARQKSRPV